MILFNPRQHTRYYPDEQSRQIMRKTIEFFENKGKQKIKEDDQQRVWYADFLEFQKEEKLFATLLTPTAHGPGDTRWDTWRNCEFNEILSFFGLPYWYTWQVTILGLGPIWMSRNDAITRRTAQLLQDGAIFAFGLSERDHGADVYSTEMKLTPKGDGTYLANGRKYYISNANKAEIVSTFGKIEGSNDYVFFAANFHDPRYQCVKNVVASQNYVGEYALRDYPITDADILSRGQDAWDSALNTVNIGKYNLGWASIGLCTHSLYESINHASNRVLYKMHVTDFPHVRQLFVDAYCRLVAMKLFALRAGDYMRVASPGDRRYLLYNPIVKMKVTTQGEEVINLLWDVIAAKGFEKDTFFEMAARDIRALPKLEDTVHVNIALIVKFMANYFFNPALLPDVGRQSQAADDAFLFNQGPAKGLGEIRFHDYQATYSLFDCANIAVFREQTALFKEMLAAATPTGTQQKDIDFLLALGEIFTLIAYGQLVLENARIYSIENEVVDQIFDFMVRDFSKFALQIYSKPSPSPKQTDYCLKMIRRPIVDPSCYQKVWQDHVCALNGAYDMKK